MLKYIALAVVAIVGVVLGLATQQPDSFSVRRSTTLQAHPTRSLCCLPTFTAGLTGHPGRRWTRP